MNARDKDRAAKKAAIVAAYQKAPSFSEAARICRVPVKTALYWKHNDEDFQTSLEEARDVYRDTLREEADRRAKGFRRPVLYKGQLQYVRDPETGEVIFDPLTGEAIVLTEIVYSDQVLLKMMEAEVPEYKRKGGGVGIEVPGGDGKAPTKIVINFQDPPDWENVEWDEETGRAKLPE